MADSNHHAPGRDVTGPATGRSSRIRDPLAALASKNRLAGLAIGWERLWPRLALPFSIVGLFLALAWLRAFDWLGDWARLALTAAFGLAFLASLVPLLRIRRATAPETISRLERDSGYEHRPLTTLADMQAGGSDDAASRALWEAHRRRVAAGIEAIRVKPPSPRLDRRDPYVLRAAVFLVFIVGLVVARGDLLSPVASAFRMPEAVGPQVRVDAWVTPPAYTRRAPVFLTASAAADAATEGMRVNSPTEPLSVPEGSVVALRVNGIGAPVVQFLPAGSGEPVLIEGEAAGMATSSAADGVVRPTAYEYQLEGSGTVVLADGEQELRRFDFAVEADLPPSIRLVEDPAATARGAFRLAYAVADDHRVAGAGASFDQPKTALDGSLVAPSAIPRPLVGPPEMPLVLPRRGAESPNAETFRDLSAHPWAGAVTAMRLVARDDAGNIGTSAPLDVVIPARPFRDPLARTLVEQRRILALDANRALFVRDVLDTLLLHSPSFIDDASVHLGLRIVANRIRDARSDDDLRDVLDLMWEMALAIDGGDASLAEQRLREARERLREALQNDASPEEIARLTEELREAMQEYMQALQEQMRNNPQLAEPSQQDMRNAQEVSPQDFQEMIDRIEELSRLGDKEAAEQLLSQLDRMLENLQMARPQQQGQQGQQGQQNEMMNELADMIRRQQELMNETFRMSPEGGQRPPGQRGQQGQQGQQGMTEEQMAEALRRLQEGQAALEERLQEMMRQMEEGGMQPGDQLGEAGESMGEAEQSLGQGQPGEALGQQGQALDQLRQGAQQLAEQMGEQEGEGQGRRGRSAYSEDPLGRPQRREGPDFGDTVKVPGEIEVQRARRILEELRRRFSEEYRPSIELDYLERLLNPF